VQQRLNVLAETASTPAHARIEKLGADARIQPDAGHHLRGLGAHALADVRHLVGEADFHGQEGVGGVLDHFRAGKRGSQ